MITELTEEQKKMIPVFVDKWTKIRLSCEPIKDHEETINLFYEKVLNKKRPAKIVLLPSPLQAWQQAFQLKKQERQQLWREYEQERQQVWEQVLGQVREQGKQQVCEQIEQVWDQVWKRVWKRKQEWEQELYHLPYLLDCFFGFGNFAFCDYLNQVLGVQYPENWAISKKIAELGLIYLCDDVCIVSDRPEQISMKNGVLHNETGMIVKYRDGWGIYKLNGVIVTKEIFETPPDKLDPEIILKERNAEVRREIVRKIGVERLEKKLKPRILDKWGDYELHDYSHLFKYMRCKPVYLKMKNPSIGVWHYEGVNIDEMEAPTCQAALKWRLKGKDFKPIRIT